MGDSTDTAKMDATSTKSGVTGNTQLSSIVPTVSAGASQDSISTSEVSTTTLYSSYGDAITESSQFPMQHATQQLPSDQVPMATTEPVSFKSEPVQGQTSQSKYQSGIKSDKESSELVTTVTTSSVSDSVNDSTSDAADDIVAGTQSVISSKSSDIQSGTLADDKTETDNAATSESGVAQTFTDHIKPTDSIVKSSTSSNKADIAPSSSETHTIMSSELFSTYTPVETSFSSTVLGGDSVSLTTTKAVPLPPLSMTPLLPAAKGDSTILGGGLSDYIIYIGVPFCGLAILILLIVCILCIRRRKAKAKGSPVKNRVEDLWVNNSRTDVQLISRNTIPEPNGGEAITSEDIAKWATNEPHSGVRKRKVKLRDKSKTGGGDETKRDLIETDEGCTTYEAVFDYKGELSTHLQLKQGNLVRVHRKEAAGWWRGTVGDQSGWFPSNHVQAAPPDNVKTENEIEMHDDSYVTSFVGNRLEEPNHRQSYIVNEPNHRMSTPTEEEIEAEPIYCKIQPKDKRKSLSDRSNSTTPTKSDTLSLSQDPIADNDIHYVALYPFVARIETELSCKKGDLVLCKECTNRNGWMRGTNDITKQEGWIPTSYVQKVEEEEKPQLEHNSKLDLDPSSYRHLEVNTNMEDRHDLVGIVHRAIHTFTAEKAGDLEFDIGDLITVFQILENGWWLGCKDKTVGWFPGTFVEMIDQPSASPSLSSVSSSQSPAESPVPNEDIQQLPEDSPRSQPQTDIRSPPQSKLRPMRKAPAPPKSNKPHETQTTDATVCNTENKPESKLPTPGGSRLPKMARPKVPPPLPPSLTHIDHQDSPLSDSINKHEHSDVVNRNISNKPVSSDNQSELDKQNVSISDGLYELINEPNSNDIVPTPKRDKIKPPVPKRYIQPKLVTVPKTEVQMSTKDILIQGLINGDLMRLRSPPPPRPAAPKLGPIRAKLAEPKPLEDQIPSEEDNTFFQVTPQRKFDAVLRQESGEHESESESPYKSLSSFGSSFGSSSFGKPQERKQLNQGDIPDAHIQRASKDKENVDIEKIVDNKSTTLNATVHNEIEECAEIRSRIQAPVDQENQCKTVSENAETIKHENVGNDSAPLHNSAENEPKVKSGIPLTPKMKVSRLPPPKQLSPTKGSDPEKIDETMNDSDKTVASSPAEKPTKLQKPRKFSANSKIPLSPNDSPRKKVEDSDVFQFPEAFSPNTTDAPLKDDKHKNEHIINKDVNSNEANCGHIETHQARPRTDSCEKRPRTDSLENRSRTDSFGKPPVAPKPKSGLPKLSKPKSSIRDQEEIKDTTEHVVHGKSPIGEEKSLTDNRKSPEIPAEIYSPASPTIPVTQARLSESESDNVTDDKSKSVTPGSKIPHGNVITQQSPNLRGRKSNIPSPGVRRKIIDRNDKTVSSPKKPGSESDGPISPGLNLKQTPESPCSPRKATSKQISSAEKQSLRNRSNSPAGRTGIPTTVRNRSNSPALRSPGIPVARTNSPSSKLTPKHKTRGLVPPKKILNGQDNPLTNTDPESIRHPDIPGLNSTGINDEDIPEDGSTDPKPERPSKPPRVQKQKYQKPPKHGKSLLPVIHKSMETGSSSPNEVSQTTPGTKPKRGIPVAKPARPPAPQTPPEDRSEDLKRTLYQAVSGYTAQIDGELTFSEGTFVKELSDCDRAGWYVGMLADGTTGLYPGDHFKPSPLSAQSEA